LSAIVRPSGVSTLAMEPIGIKESSLERVHPSLSLYRRGSDDKQNEIGREEMREVSSGEKLTLKDTVKPKRLKKKNSIKMSGERVYETMTMGPVRRVSASEIDNTHYPQSSLKVYRKRSEELDKDPSQPNYLRPKIGIPYSSLERFETVKSNVQVNLWMKQHEEMQAQEGKEKADRHNLEILSKSKIRDSFQEMIGKVEAGDYQDDPRYKELLGVLNPLILPSITEWRQKNHKSKTTSFDSFLHKYGFHHKNDAEL